MKTITVEKIGYIIKGYAVLTDWYNQRGYIEMKPFRIKKLTSKQLKEGLNDNGFGCQSIDGAEVHVYEEYERGVEELVDSKFINLSKMSKKEIKKACNEIVKVFQPELVEI